MQDSLNAMSILERVYSQTQNQELREKELTEYIDKLKERGKTEIIDYLSTMHINEGASENFSAFASTFKIDPNKTDSLKFSPSGQVKNYRDQETQAKANMLSSELYSDLNKSIDEYNRLTLTQREYFDTIEEKEERRDIINQELDEYQSVISQADDRKSVFQQEYWSRLNPIGMLVGGKTARMQALFDNPDLVDEKRQLDDDIYQMKYGENSIYRDDNFSLAYKVAEDNIDDILNSLRVLEGDLTKTQLEINVDGTYKNIKGN